MGICARYQPVERDGVQKGLNIFFRTTGLLPEQGYDASNSRSAIIFVFVRGVETESLAHVFLVNTQPATPGARGRIVLRQ
jgi:hypothetical protein